MKTIKLSIVITIVVHVLAWAVGIINFNPSDYSTTWLGLNEAEQSLINLIPSTMGSVIVLGPKLAKWIESKLGVE